MNTSVAGDSFSQLTVFQSWYVSNISTLPVRVETWDVLFVTLAAVVISFFATIYPSWHASRLNPVEALRYE